MKKPVFLMAASTNGTDVLELLQMAKAQLTRSCKPYLVFDGHRTHEARAVKAFMEEHFVPLKLLKHSCEFNVQEKVNAERSDCHVSLFDSKVWRTVKLSQNGKPPPTPHTRARVSPDNPCSLVGLGLWAISPISLEF